MQVRFSAIFFQIVTMCCLAYPVQAQSPSDIANYQAEQNSDEAIRLQLYKRQPKAGSPTYQLTSNWINSNFFILGYKHANTSTYEFLSMNNCILTYKIIMSDADLNGLGYPSDKSKKSQLVNVPLSDGSMAIVGDALNPGLSLSTNHNSIGIEGYKPNTHSYHNDTVDHVTIPSESDFDTAALVKRLADAINHASKLCRPLQVKNKEIF